MLCNLQHIRLTAHRGYYSASMQLYRFDLSCSLQLQNKYDILPHIYEKFSKSDIAQLCQDIARCKLVSYPAVLGHSQM